MTARSISISNQMTEDKKPEVDNAASSETKANSLIARSVISACCFPIIKFFSGSCHLLASVSVSREYTIILLRYFCHAPHLNRESIDSETDFAAKNHDS